MTKAEKLEIQELIAYELCKIFDKAERFKPLTPETTAELAARLSEHAKGRRKLLTRKRDDARLS